jgi:hypothetical protein
MDDLRRHLTGEPGLAEVETLEQRLRSFSDGVSAVPERQRSLLAMRFYLRDLLWASTNYMLSSNLTGGQTNHVTLVGRALDWCRAGDRCCVFVSFNYDLLLEYAMAAWWGFDWTKIESYLSHDVVHLLKPHGSVQWYETVSAPNISASSPTQHGAYSITVALIEGKTTPGLHSMGDFMSSPGMLPAIPAVGLPIDRKNDDSFVWPSPQRERLLSLEGTVSRLLTIGWRGLEPHFVDLLGPLVRPDARVLVAAGDGTRETQGDAGLTMQQLEPRIAVEPTAWKLYESGFSELLGSTELLRFLS